jgi:UDP-glucose-4-epimerase GalE
MKLKNHRIFLVTGGAGYIGTHFVEAWLASPSFQNDRLVVVDNLSTGHGELIDELAMRDSFAKFGSRVTLIKHDLLDQVGLNEIFKEHHPDAVLHFAAKISVAESVEKPDLYFQNNVVGSQHLIAAMKTTECRKIVFSSTAAVYGMVTTREPILENAELKPINPYGDTKLAIENAIRDAGERWNLNSIILRYFNASGASPSGVIGEWHEPETHLIPLLLESVVAGKTPLKLFGTDYETRDGTCVRDYIHVSDLASAHLLALQQLLGDEFQGTEVYNLGTETGTTVREVIEAAEKVCQKKVLIEEHPRRSGDAAMLVASSKKATLELGWVPQHSKIEEILKTAYHWQQKLAEKQPKS